jgi:formylglycine-generating enzyme
MKDHPDLLFSFRKQAAFWFLALACGLFGVYLLFRWIGAQPASPGVCESELPQLRQLAALDTIRLAEMLNHSVSVVPAGEFLMGSNTGSNDERPQHSVYLDAFEIDCFEVTNAQFAQLLSTTDRLPPPYWSGQDYPAGQADYPVVGVPWEDAADYCNWVGKRLPTEAEWEKAARGLDGRTYPWGNNWDPSRANVFVPHQALNAASPAASSLEVWDQAWEFLRTSPPRPSSPSLKPVGSYPQGKSPFDLMDMAGNASEWVADWYNWSDYSGLPSRNPYVLGPPWNHSLRGSPWYDPVGNAAWVQAMSRTSARSSSHDSRDPRIGFRCAQSSPAKNQ